MINENEALKYEIMVNKRSYGKFGSMSLAEQFLQTLSNDLRETAVIIPVTSEGKQVLLG